MFEVVPRKPVLVRELTVIMNEKYVISLNSIMFGRNYEIVFPNKTVRGEAAKLAHLIESASLKRKYMTKNYEKIFI